MMMRRRRGYLCGGFATAGGGTFRTVRVRTKKKENVPRAFSSLGQKGRFSPRGHYSMAVCPKCKMEERGFYPR